MLGGSKRVLAGTKSADKIAAIKEGVAVLEQFLEDFDRENRSRHNLAYLPATVGVALPPAADKLAAEFVQFYAGDRVHGNYKHLRTLYPLDEETDTWDIVRNRAVNKLKAEGGGKWFKDDGSPTDNHLAMLYWAYSPQPDKVTAWLATTGKSKKGEEGSKAEKRKSMPSSSSSSEEEVVKKKKSKH